MTPRSAVRPDASSATEPGLGAPLALVADERTWVARIRAGDGPAFEEMFRAYSDPLVRFAYGFVGDEAVAEDLVEDVFFRIWQRRAGWEVRQTVRAYLYSATHHRVVNHLKHVRVRTRWTAAAVPEESARTSTPADEAAELSQYRAAVARGVALLPERCREVFVLHRQHGLTRAEIAQLLSLSPKTVENHLGRALKSLRVSLAEYLGRD